jgi:hypothetical protein
MSSGLLDQLLRPDERTGLSRSVGHGSRNLLDDLNQFFASITVVPGKAHEFTSSLKHRIAIDCAPTHSDASPSSELNEPFVS